jgi:CelD/BcsL family acetyltransferase involved in cellulose biosynthesis
MRIESVRDTPGLLELEAEWRALLAQSVSDAVFLSWEWVATWWEVFGARFTPHVLVARDGDGTACGIAPLMLGPGPGRARALRHLMFIGQQGETASEYLDFIVAAGREAEVGAALARALLGPDGSGWDVLSLESVRSDAVCLAALEPVLAEAGLRAEVPRRQVSPYAELPASWEELLRARSKHFRKKYQYGWNVLAREGPVDVVLVEGDLPLDEALDHLAALNRDRWGEGGQSFRTPDYLAFHRQLARRLQARQGLLFFFVRLNGRRVAARYDFVYGGKAWCFQGGWLREFEDASVGQLALGKAIELAIARGCREYDFLGGDSDYKRRWSTGERTLLDLWVARSWRARAFRFARRLRDRFRPAR